MRIHNENVIYYAFVQTTIQHTILMKINIFTNTSEVHHTLNQGVKKKKRQYISALVSYIYIYKIYVSSGPFPFMLIQKISHIFLWFYFFVQITFFLEKTSMICRFFSKIFTIYTGSIHIHQI